MNGRVLMAVLGLLGGMVSNGAMAMSIEERVSNQCASCHGAQGQSVSPLFPSLAGQNAEYMVKQLNEFKSGKRKNETMSPQVVDLSAADIKGLAAHYAAKPARVNRVSDEDLIPVGRYIYAKGNNFSGVPACADCHGADGHGTTSLPRLAGQNSRYLLSQLKEFNQRVRTNDNQVMHLVASRLTELEAKAVADYLSQMP